RRDRAGRREHAAVIARDGPGAADDRDQSGQRGRELDDRADLRRARLAAAVPARGDRRAGAAGRRAGRPPSLARRARADIVAAMLMKRAVLLAGAVLVAGLVGSGCTDNSGNGNPGVGGSSAGAAGTTGSAGT